MPRRSQASTHSGVGMLCDVRTALPPMSFNTPMRIPLHPVGQRRAHAGVILMVAGAFDLDGFAVEEKSLVGIPLDVAHAEGDALRVAGFAAGFDRDDSRVQIRSLRRPQRRIRNRCAAPRSSPSHRAATDLRCRVCRRNNFSRRIENLPAHAAGFRLRALVLHDRVDRSSVAALPLIGCSHRALPMPQMQRVGFRQPHMPVNSRALVEPAIAKAGVHAHHQNNSSPP